MNPQFESAFRSILIALGGALVSFGVVDESTVMPIVGAVMAIVPAAWSFYRQRTNGIIASAAALPEVKKLVTTDEIANSSTFKADPTVVSVAEARIADIATSPGSRYR